MSEPQRDEVSEVLHLMVSRRGIVHAVWSPDDYAATACGKGSRDLVLIGAVGTGERMCHACARVIPSGEGATNA